MTKEQLDQLTTDLGTQTAAQIKTQVEALEKNLNTKYADMKTGTVSAEDFNKFKEDQLKSLNDLIKKADDLAQANKEQAEKIDAFAEGQKATKGMSMAEFLKPHVAKLVDLKAIGSGFIEVTGAQMKAAGITGIGTSISPATPYLPGLAGTPLEIFDIVRPQDFMLTRVDLGSTDQFKLAWINELPMEGEPNVNLTENQVKPLVQHLFTVEISTALKAAAYSILTEEFEQDVPGLASDVRGMLQTDVFRALDNAIQAYVFSVAQTFNLTGLQADIFMANLWDAVYALLTQVGYNEFIPDTLAMNWITSAKMHMSKNGNGTYLLPPFREEVERLLVRANKIDTNVGLAGDLKQVKVRLYKDYTLRMGWINDDFIRNRFAILGELRYHRFISENRKKALVKGDLNNIVEFINGTPGS